MKILTKILTSIAMAAVAFMGSALIAYAAPYQFYQGGTGTSTQGVTGQLLQVQSNGNYQAVSTSTLGLPTLSTLSSYLLTSAFGTNFYTFFHATTTDALAQGSTNKYDQTVVLTNGTGISNTGTYPNFTITNTAPDQTVVLTAGTGIATSGSYPNFTITNSLSTTSWAYFLSQNQGAAYSTTSADYWKTQRDFFSTTSATYFLSINQGAAFSTTSANAYINASSTIPHPAGGAIGNLIQWDGTKYVSVATSTLGLGGSGGGSVTSVNASGGTTGLTFSGGPITTSGTLTAAGTLVTANGGTGLTTTGASSTVLTTDGTNPKWNKLATSQLTNDSGFLTSAVSSLAQTYGTAQTGALSFGTSSDPFNGLNFNETITNSGTSFTFANVVTGSLGAGGGGTGITNPTAAQVLLGSYAGGAWQQLATSSLGINFSDLRGLASLTSQVTGVLPIANGGTNASSFTTSGNAAYYTGSALATAPLTSAVTTPYASSTAISAPTICVGTDCRTAWPSAGGGAYPFQGANNSTSTITGFTAGLYTSASSTLQGTTTLTGNVGFPFASTTSATTQTVNWQNGITQRFLLTANTNFAINSTSSSPTDGGKYIIKICQDGTGSRTASFITPGQMRWSLGTTTVASGANQCTWIGMIYDAYYSTYTVLASTTAQAQ